MMSYYFDRVVAVSVSPDIYIRELKIKFEIKKSILPDQNYSRVDIYNLNTPTRNKITSDVNSVVKVEAGYVNTGGLISIGIGNISNVIHTVKSPDIITTIYSKDGFKAVANNYISFSFVNNSKLSSVIETIVAKLKLPVKFANYDKNIRIKNGYSYIGSIPDALNSLGRQYGFTWSIQNNELLILDGNTSTGNTILSLSSQTGLIESPELIIKTKNLNELKVNEYRVTALLQPQLQVGELVNINSILLNGVFKINELTHVGDITGDEWYTKMVVTTYD